MKRGLTAAEHQALGQFRVTLGSLLKDNLVSVRLFGSRARAEGTLESDLDVLVVLREKNPRICRQIVEVALDADLAYGTNLAPMILTVDEYNKNRQIGSPFYRNVERDAVAL